VIADVGHFESEQFTQQLLLEIIQKKFSNFAVRLTESEYKPRQILYLMEQTVEQKLKALYELQTIHTKIDKIRQVRGELPMEVADLEDDVAGLGNPHSENQK
jgi:hypothetical protein